MAEQESRKETDIREETSAELEGNDAAGSDLEDKITEDVDDSEDGEDSALDDSAEDEDSEEDLEDSGEESEEDEDSEEEQEDAEELEQEEADEEDSGESDDTSEVSDPEESADDSEDSGEESEEDEDSEEEQEDAEESEQEEAGEDVGDSGVDSKDEESPAPEKSNSGEAQSDIDPKFAEKVTQSAHADTDAPQAEKLDDISSENIASQPINYQQPEVQPLPQKQPLPKNSERRSMVAIENMPVTLTFETGRHKITVGELEKLKEGYTFECGNPIEAPVTICANDIPIGIGELVDIDGRIGVRVVKFDNNK